MSSKTDWKWHQVNYAQNYVHLDISVAAYAREYELNLNSARRSMGGKDEIEKLRADILAGAHPDLAGLSKKPIKNPANNKAKPAKSDRKSDRSTSDQLPKSDHSDRSPAEADHPSDQGVSSDAGRSPRGAERARPGNETPNRKKAGAGSARQKNHAQVTVISCDYADPLKVDREIFELALSIAQGDEDLVLSQARHLVMVRAQNKMSADIARDYDSGNPWKDSETGLIIPRAQAEYQAVFGTAQRIAEQEANLTRRKLGMRKQALDERKQALAERELHPLTLAERIEYTRVFMDRREAEGLTAIETARLFEREGISLPRSLQVELAREVSWLEPAVDADGGITDEELEQQSRKYLEEQREVMESWLPARREEVEAVLAAELAIQAGDMLNEDEFEENPEDWVDLDPESKEEVWG